MICFKNLRLNVLNDFHVNIYIKKDNPIKKDNAKIVLGLLNYRTWLEFSKKIACTKWKQYISSKMWLQLLCSHLQRVLENVL